MHVRWLRLVTRITYLSKLIGTPSLAAFLKLELFRVYICCPLFLMFNNTSSWYALFFLMK
ncbi:hypothetical protein DF214_00135 [Pectobacterium atrosepticum]|nr:hypothetical protein CVS35_22040 [Pectobacterium atrosepticum]PWD67740.1 hypothetical protein DF214_00135 [Pectobacterium atrosepticum]